VTQSPIRTLERLALRQTVRHFKGSDVRPHRDDSERAGDLPLDLHRRTALSAMLLGYTS
jgi:acyl-CoA dehydrogenase